MPPCEGGGRVISHMRSLQIDALAQKIARISASVWTTREKCPALNLVQPSCERDGRSMHQGRAICHAILGAALFRSTEALLPSSHLGLSLRRGLHKAASLHRKAGETMSGSAFLATCSSSRRIVTKFTARSAFFRAPDQHPSPRDPSTRGGVISGSSRQRTCRNEFLGWVAGKLLILARPSPQPRQRSLLGQVSSVHPDP